MTTGLTWRGAKKLKLWRQSPCKNPMYTGHLEPGVNFFVLALEQYGATTHYSCEGHPTGFYVLFEADYALAMQIQAAGYFSVEIEGENLWSIRTRAVDEEQKNHVLTHAAEAWAKHLGPVHRPKTNK